MSKAYLCDICGIPIPDTGNSEIKLALSSRTFSAEFEEKSTAAPEELLIDFAHAHTACKESLKSELQKVISDACKAKDRFTLPSQRYKRDELKQ
ncbi:MAG: hypothetical protein HQK56_20525 [Deltaproteobacteria bacterium]|nr:hypothetical protein [Deltaproteobacteria bacterium]